MTTSTSVHKTERLRRLLGAMLLGPKASYSFTGGELANLSIAPIQIQRYLGELVKDGRATLTGDKYAITAKGKAWLALFEPPPPVRYDKYQPPQWHIRAGSDAFMDLPSRGQQT